MFIATSRRRSPSTGNFAMTSRKRAISGSVRSLTCVVGIDACGFAGHQRAVAADAEDVRQRDPNVLVGRNVDARYTCHSVLTS